MRRHGPVIAHCTDSEDFPAGVPLRPRPLDMVRVWLLLASLVQRADGLCAAAELLRTAPTDNRLVVACKYTAKHMADVRRKVVVAALLQALPAVALQFSDVCTSSVSVVSDVLSNSNLPDVVDIVNNINSNILIT